MHDRRSVEERSRELRPVLSLGDLILAQVLYIMGMGWVGVAAKLGSSHLVFWLLAIFLFYLPSAVVVLYLTRWMPLEGGLYQWAKFGFSERTGFLVAWNLWVYVIVLNSEIGLQGVTMLAYGLGPSGSWLLQSRLATAAASMIMVSALVAISLRGLAVGRWVQNAGGFCLLAMLVALIALPFRNLALGRMTHYQPFPTQVPELSLLNLNVLGKMGFGALGGFEFMSIFAAECRAGGRAIRRSVLIATPLIALLFILGTSAVAAFTEPAHIDLVSPIAQALTTGTRPGDRGTSIIPLLIFGMLGIRVAQCSQAFAGSSRLPLVTGWDDLLPAWFTRIDKRWGTPVNSILFVGCIVLVMSIVGIAGVGRQEGFQLLNNASGILYGIAYLVMFALAIVGVPGAPPPPLWLRAAAVSGFLMTLLYEVLSVIPIINVPNPVTFSAKVLGIIFGANAIGVLLYVARKRRAYARASTASAATG